MFKELPCLVAEVLSPSTAATDSREKLQAYRGVSSLHYYLLIDSERVFAAYYVRGADGDWLAATLEHREQIQIECGPVRAELGLNEI